MDNPYSNESRKVVPCSHGKLFYRNPNILLLYIHLDVLSKVDLYHLITLELSYFLLRLQLQQHFRLPLYLNKFHMA